MTDSAATTPSELAMSTVARRSLAMSVGSLVGSVLSIVTSFVVARWLGPERFGRVQEVLLLYLYAALIRSGTFESAVRRFIRLSAQGREEEARRAITVGTTVDMAVSAIPAFGLVIWGIASDGLTRQGLLLAPLIVLSSTAAAYAGGLRSAERRFDEVAASGVIRSFAYTVLALGGVACFGDVALFVAPAVADVLALGFLVLRRPRMDLRPGFDLRLAAELVGSGLALGALPAVYWAYRLVGSTTVAAWSGPVTFGLFSFAAAPVAVVLRAISQVDAVLTPAVWGEIARDEGDRRWVPAADRVTTTLFLVSGLATNLGQASFAPMVGFFLPEYVGASQLFDVLSLNIVLLSVAAVPSLVLSDEVHGNQNRFLALWVGALAVNLALNVATLSMGFGPLIVAWNDVWVQAVVVVLLFAMAGRRLGVPDWGRRAAVGVPLVAATAATMVALRFLLADRPDSVGDLVVRVVGRASTVAAVWAVLGWVMRGRIRAISPSTAG